MEAKDYLIDDVTFVVKNHHTIHTSKARGISPVLNFVLDHPELLIYSDVADRIIGKAAAMLLARTNIRSLYAEVLSEKAIPILEKYGVPYEYGQLTKEIKNRTNTGNCPMEEAVKDIDNLDLALEAIINKDKEINYE